LATLLIDAAMRVTGGKFTILIQNLAKNKTAPRFSKTHRASGVPVYSAFPIETPFSTVVALHLLSK